MNDFISRQAAIDAVRSYYDECDEREESIEERIERLPSADMDLSGFSDKLWAAAYARGKAEAQAEIVRCKDCMYWVAHDKRCAYLNHGFAPNMWCCHGRRTDEKENI